MKDMYGMLERFYSLSIWDRNGRQYLPLFGYDGQVEAYAPAYQAIAIFNQVYGITTKGK